MAQEITPTKMNRFVNNVVSELQEANRSPISGYQHLPVMSLEEAVESIVPFLPQVKIYANKAKEHCRKNTKLAVNESAAIYLYTESKSFYSTLNQALRAENPHALEPWFAFLKLFITAIGKLPSSPTKVWRGVAESIGSDYDEDDVQTWWSVNSCSSYLNVAGMFTGDKGTLFCIDTIHGKDITKYSAIQDEQEVLLMPGTRLRVKGTRFEANGLSVVHLEECGTIPEGQHVMLSYNWNSQDIVSEIYQILRDEHIPVWFDEQGDMKDNMYNSMADGVENSSVVCCFMTPDYEKSANCKLELQYAQKRHKRIIPCLLSDAEAWKPCDWLEVITIDLMCIDFHDDSKSNIHSKTRELIERVKEQPSVLKNLPSKTVGKPSYLLELIRREYKRNSRIERIMNPSKSFPIEQSYINLAIVETKEQLEKEKKLLDAMDSNNDIIGTFEEIYGKKTAIEIKNIFERCKDQTKQILVLGRAGIGKTTFCQYVAYQWAAGVIWQQYQLVIIIRLRSLTENRYPPLAPGAEYSLIDLVKTEYFHRDLSEKDEMQLKEQLDKSQVLWVLDGYDEIVQNVPPHLKYLFKQLRETSHHILTSRPYLNTLSYNVELEITGFTDDNIAQYVEQFFKQIKDKIVNASPEAQKLLSFLKCNPRIWGIVHIPVNLELICSLWCDTDRSETTMLTMTAVYDKMIEWLCRRHLEKQNSPINQQTKDGIYPRCHKELRFLESLAFNGMKSNSIIIRPKLLQTASKEADCSLEDQLHFLNIGILKSLDYKPTGTRIEPDKDHYFLHLSFQEHFAARYLVKAINDNTDEKKKKAIDFIKTHKYNQRFELVFTFASGILNDNNDKQCMNFFWNTLMGEPLDLIGVRHIQLVISCIEETGCNRNLPRFSDIMNSIIEWIKYSVSKKQHCVYTHMEASFQRSPSLVNQPEILQTLLQLHQNNDSSIRKNATLWISTLPIAVPDSALIKSMIEALNDNDPQLRSNTCEALGKMGKKIATNEVINGLVDRLGDTNDLVRWKACEALGKLGEKAATNEVINRYVRALQDTNLYDRRNALEALGNIGEKAATAEVIDQLVSALGDTNDSIRLTACKALQTMNERVATNVVTNRLVRALDDRNLDIRRNVCETLGKLGIKAANNETINRLVNALRNWHPDIRRSACKALGNMGEKAATTEVIDRLVSVLGDTNYDTSQAACEALRTMGEKAATTEVIDRLVSVLGDTNYNIRQAACETLRNMGEKAATNEVTNKLVSALSDTNPGIRYSACEVLGKMGEKAATNEVIDKLANLLWDKNDYVRRSACEVLGKMDEKAATKKVISRLVSVLSDTNPDIRRNACEALGKMGEKAATKEVISRLVSALQDVDVHVKCSACEAIGKMGEKAASNEVINGLVNALQDVDVDVKHRACEAIGKMGEKAATNEVINRLVNALQDVDVDVKNRACEAIGKMGEKAATNEAIKNLLNTLEDTNTNIRYSACKTLGNMGEKAATDETISRLLIAVGDTNDGVRYSACEAFGKLGIKAANNEMINGLVNALWDTNPYVKHSAFKALANMGQKAATNEAINRLLNALRDTNPGVRYSACEVLGKMGEKAATNEVISRLVNVLGDMDKDVRRNALDALGILSGKAATNEVINRPVNAVGDVDTYIRPNVCQALEILDEKVATNETTNRLVNLLWDKNDYVRRSACESLGKMGEKAATNETFYRLVNALEHANEHVRLSACEHVGRMGEKAARHEVIERLGNLFWDKNEKVRRSACEAFGRLGLKAGNNEMINRLVNGLGDTNSNVRRNTCEDLGKIGEIAATNEVIRGLLNACNDKDPEVQHAAIQTSENILSLLSCMSHFDLSTVQELSSSINRFSWKFLGKVSPEKFVVAFLKTEIAYWLSILKVVLLREGYAITVTENTILLYGIKAPTEVAISSQELGEQLKKAFDDWPDGPPGRYGSKYYFMDKEIK